METNHALTAAAYEFHLSSDNLDTYQRTIDRIRQSERLLKGEIIIPHGIYILICVLKSRSDPKLLFISIAAYYTRVVMVFEIQGIPSLANKTRLPFTISFFEFATPEPSQYAWIQ